jgi:hypothetical protein
MFFIALADEDIKDFESEFGELWSDASEEAKAASELAKEEAEIAKENELYEKGEASFSEKLNELSALTKAQFEDEKEGAIAHEEPFATGLIETPEEMRKLSREDQEYLDRLDWDP